MVSRSTTTDRLKMLTKICLSLPGTTRQDKGGHAAFLVGRRIFAYYLNHHHGDGIVGLSCKVLAGDNVKLVEASPRKFYMPAYVGPRGWVGLRLDRASVDWNEVTELTYCSYVQIAPKRLQKLL